MQFRRSELEWLGARNEKSDQFHFPPFLTSVRPSWWTFPSFRALSPQGAGTHKPTAFLSQAPFYFPTAMNTSSPSCRSCMIWNGPPFWSVAEGLHCAKRLIQLRIWLQGVLRFTVFPGFDSHARGAPYYPPVKLSSSPQCNENLKWLGDIIYRNVGMASPKMFPEDFTPPNSTPISQGIQFPRRRCGK